MKSQWTSPLALCAALVSGSVFAIANQATPVADAQPAAQAKNGNANGNEKTGLPRFASGLGDIVKLTKAKVAESVILAFVRNSSIPYRLSVDEILELRELGVSAPVLTAMLDRGNELRQAARAQAQAASQAQAPAPAATTAQPATVYYAPRSEPASSPTVVYASYPAYYNYSYVPWYWYPNYYSYYYPRYYYPYRSYFYVSGHHHHGHRHHGHYGGHHGSGHRGHYVSHHGGHHRHR